LPRFISLIKKGHELKTGSIESLSKLFKLSNSSVSQLGLHTGIDSTHIHLKASPQYIPRISLTFSPATHHYTGFFSKIHYVSASESRAYWAIRQALPSRAFSLNGARRVDVKPLPALRDVRDSCENDRGVADRDSVCIFGWVWLLDADMYENESWVGAICSFRFGLS
jgi:hypothetical protein